MPCVEIRFFLSFQPTFTSISDGKGEYDQMDTIMFWSFELLLPFSFVSMDLISSFLHHHLQVLLRDDCSVLWHQLHVVICSRPWLIRTIQHINTPPHTYTRTYTCSNRYYKILGLIFGMSKLLAHGASFISVFSSGDSYVLFFVSLDRRTGKGCGRVCSFGRKRFEKEEGIRLSLGSIAVSKFKVVGCCLHGIASLPLEWE